MPGLFFSAAGAVRQASGLICLLYRACIFFCSR